MSGAARRRVVFLDRDGTINVKAPEGHYITSPDEVQLLPGAGAAVARLNRSDYHVALVTNQRGIALGRMSVGDYESVHARLVALLAEHGARLDSAYFCPHDRSSCTCRKPDVGMLVEAAAQAGVESASDCVMVGDATSDVIAGKRFGATTIRIGDRAGSDTAEGDADPDLTAASLHAAVDLLLGADV